MKYFCVADKDTKHVIRTGLCPDDSFDLQAQNDSEIVIEMSENALPRECAVIGSKVIISK